MKKLLVVLCVSVMFFCSAGMANALLVDFTAQDPWGDAIQPDGTEQSTGWITVHSFLDVKVIAKQAGDYLTFNANDGLPVIPGFAGEGDGIGIVPVGDADEIDDPERLRINFSPQATLNMIYLLDLFSEEVAEINLRQDDEWGGWTSYGGTSTNDYGFLGIMYLAVEDVQSIIFDAGIGNYAVAGVDVDPVPEPTTMLLLGSGLLGLAGLGRKKFFKKG